MPIKNRFTAPKPGIITGQRVTTQKLHRAKELRRSMTPAERVLWQVLRGNKLGAHFRRQQVIAGFIVDFYCHKASLILELDGSVHDTSEQYARDREREKALTALGLRVARFRNREILSDLPGVLERIRTLLAETPS